MLGDYLTLNRYLWPGMIPSGPMTPALGPATPGINGAAPDPDTRIAPRTPIGGDGLSDDEQKTARRRLALMLGVNLLSAAPTGDFGGGLARGVAAAAEDRDVWEERRRQRLRQEVEDKRLEAAAKRQAEAHQDSLESSRQGRTHAEEDQGFQRESQSRLRTVWGQEDDDRGGRRASAEAMVAEIKSVAGDDSYEARRAEALLLAGPESLPDLKALHDSSVTRSRREEDADFKADQEIELRRRIYSEDPQAAFDRGIELRRIAATEASVAGGGSEGSRVPTATSLLSTLNAETRRVYEMELVARGLSYDGKRLAPGADRAELNAAWAAAEAQAEENVRQRIGNLWGAGAFPGSGGGAPPDSAAVDAKLREVQISAGDHGVRLTPTDLEAIRRDLAMGATPQQVMERLLGK